MTTNRADQFPPMPEGGIVQRGRSIVFCESEVRGGTSDTLAATASLTYKVSSKPLKLR